MEEEKKNKNLENYIYLMSCIYNFQKRYVGFLVEFFKLKKQANTPILLNKTEKEKLAKKLGFKSVFNINAMITELKKQKIIINVDRGIYIENQEIFKDLDKFLKDNDEVILLLTFKNGNFEIN